MNFATFAVDKGGTGILIMLAVLPVLAAIFGYQQKPRRLRFAVIGSAILTTLYLMVSGIFLEQGHYQRGTGMEGLALIVLPIAVLLSATVALLCYVAARAFARLP